MFFKSPHWESRAFGPFCYLDNVLGLCIVCVCVQVHTCMQACMLRQDLKNAHALLPMVYLDLSSKETCRVI